MPPQAFCNFPRNRKRRKNPRRQRRTGKQSSNNALPETRLARNTLCRYTAAFPGQNYVVSFSRSSASRRQYLFI